MLTKKQIDDWFEKGQADMAKVNIAPNYRDGKWYNHIVFGKKLNPSLLDELLDSKKTND